MKDKTSIVVPSECMYRCEGNSSVVVWDKQVKRIYRLSKKVQNEEPKKKKKLTSFPPGQRASLCVDYIRHVVGPLFHATFVPDQGLVEVLSEQLELLSDQVLTYRPKHRLYNSIDTSQTTVMYMDDCCFVRQPQLIAGSHHFAVEIKPKCGYLPRTSSACQYCMLQYKKVQEGRVKVTSKYCPIDLYSGDVHRMKRAFSGLMETPQNNLRIFKDGQLVFSEENPADLDEISQSSFRSSDEFIDVLLKSLLHSPCGHKSRLVSPEASQVTCSLCSEQAYRLPGHKGNSDTVQGLPEGCVLHNVLKAQQIHDLDIGNIHHMFQSLEGTNTDSVNHSLKGPYTPDKWCVGDASLDSNSIKYMVKKVQQYLVSRTVRDCSVMVAFQRLMSLPKDIEAKDSCSFLIESSHGNMYQASVAVIDLDPKPPHKIPIYHKEEKDILSYYSQQVEARPSLENKT